MNSQLSTAVDLAESILCHEIVGARIGGNHFGDDQLHCITCHLDFNAIIWHDGTIILRPKGQAFSNIDLKAYPRSLTI